MFLLRVGVMDSAASSRKTSVSQAACLNGQRTHRKRGHTVPCDVEADMIAVADHLRVRALHRVRSSGVSALSSPVAVPEVPPRDPYTGARRVSRNASRRPAGRAHFSVHSPTRAGGAPSRASTPFGTSPRGAQRMRQRSGRSHRARLLELFEDLLGLCLRGQTLPARPLLRHEAVDPVAVEGRDGPSYPRFPESSAVFLPCPREEPTRSMLTTRHRRSVSLFPALRAAWRSHKGCILGIGKDAPWSHDPSVTTSSMKCLGTTTLYRDYFCGTL